MKRVHPMPGVDSSSFAEDSLDGAPPIVSDWFVPPPLGAPVYACPHGCGSVILSIRSLPKGVWFVCSVCRRPYRQRADGSVERCDADGSRKTRAALAVVIAGVSSAVSHSPRRTGAKPQGRTGR